MDNGESIYLEIKEKKERRRQITAAIAMVALLGLCVIIFGITY